MNKAFVREPDTTDVLCPRCGAEGISVLRAAFESHVPPEARRAMAASTYFCPTSTCPVAYFDAFEAVVSADALIGPVYPKDPAAPLCSCFGLTMEDVEADIADGTPQRIRELLAKSKTPAARCEELSPTGRSCVPNVQRCYFKLRGGV
jgi:CopZ-like zinc binding protein